MDATPINTPAGTTVLSSIRLNGSLVYTTYQGGTTAQRFREYMGKQLIPSLATEVKYMRADLNDTIERLNKLEGKDSDKWEKFKWLLVAGLVTIVLGSLAVQVGLK